MAYETNWPQYLSAFTSDATSSGIITVASTQGLYTKQQVTVSITSSAALLEVKEVLSNTTARIGAIGNNSNGTDLSAYTVVSGGQIFAPLQEKKDGGSNSVIKNVYEAAPTVALRTFGVDSSGNPGVASSAITFQFVSVANASVTAGNSTITSGFPIMTFNSLVKSLVVFNSFNQTVGLTLNNIEFIRLESADKFILDLKSDGLHIPGGTKLAVYQLGTPPTTGTLRVTAIE